MAAGAPADTSGIDPGLEGLRGVSVLAVLLFHAGYGWMQGGFLGVSTFFTLSGFLITRSLVEERARQGRVDLPAFWARRLRRLMPAALAGLLLVAVFVGLSGHVGQRMRATEDGLAALVYLSNWWFVTTDSGYEGLLGHPSPVQHFWSLSIEEQYYVVYPPLLLALMRVTRGSRAATGGGVALLAAVSWGWLAWLAGEGVPAERVYYGTDTRCGELLAGCALALLLPREEVSVRGTGPPRAGWAGLGVLGALVSLGLWAVARVDSDALYRGGLQVHALASVAIIASTRLTPGPLRWVLCLRPVRWLGRISYGAYVYHWPLYLWLEEGSLGLAGTPLALVRIALTLGLAHLSFAWLEEPIRASRWLHGRGAALALASGTLVAALALVVATRDVEPAHTLAGAFRSGALTGEPALASLGSPGSQEDGGPLRILVVGDSVAKQLAEGLDLTRREWAGTGDVSIVDASLRGCGLARSAGASTSRRQQICDDWNARYAETIDRVRPHLVLVYVAGWDLGAIDGSPESSRWLRAEYEAALELFTRDGARVAWVTPLCTRDGGRAKRTRLTREAIEPAAKAFPGRVTLVDLDAQVCPGGRFTNTLDGIDPFRPDGNHFSLAGRAWVGLWLGERIEAILERS